MRRSFAIAAVALVGAVGGPLHTFAEGSCGNAILSSETSPDAKHDAILFTRNCGATTGFSIQVSIIDHGETLADESANAFIVDAAPPAPREELVEVVFKLTWLDASQLEVAYNPLGRIYLQESRVNGVTITYREGGL